MRLPEIPDDARAVLEDLVASLAQALPGSVEGVVLFGSSVDGGFEPGLSDLDVLVAVATEIDDAALEALRGMHDRLARAHPAWEDRLDVVYASRVARESFAERESLLVIISRGEPLHRSPMDFGWVMNWHAAREGGVSLLGPPPRELIATTTTDDYVAAVRAYVPWLIEKVAAVDAPALQAYAVLACCRALHTCTTRERAPKRAAARWAEARYPEWSDTIRGALARRRSIESPAAGARSIPGGLEFLHFAAAEVSRKP